MPRPSRRGIAMSGAASPRVADVLDRHACEIQSMPKLLLDRLHSHGTKRILERHQLVPVDRLRFCRAVIRQVESDFDPQHFFAHGRTVLDVGGHRQHRRMDALDAQILDWEAAHPNPSEGAALAAATKLGITRTTWNMRLLRILDTPDALEHDPLTVYRLKLVVERVR